MTPEPTIKDIAQRLNLSKSTVSRAISGRGRIGAATRKRVMEAIDEYGYRPNAVARSLAVSRTGNIGVILPPDTNPGVSQYLFGCLAGVIEMAAFADLGVVVSSGGPEAPGLMASQRRTDGIILMCPPDTERADGRLPEAGQMPLIIIGSGSDCGAVRVGIDNAAASRELTSYLLLKSHGRVAYIGGSPGQADMRDKLSGYMDAHRECGTPTRDGYALIGIRSEAHALHHLSRLFRQDVPCAVLAADGTLCRWTLSFLKSQGLSVPGDVRVASLGDDGYMSECMPDITAVDAAPRLTGQTACRLLADWINGIKPPDENTVAHRIVLK